MNKAQKERDVKVRKLLADVSKNGKFFSVEFVRQGDGGIRKMNCRTGVKKHAKGGPRRFPDKAIGVFDCQIEEYRCFYPHTVRKVNGKAV